MKKLINSLAFSFLIVLSVNKVNAEVNFNHIGFIYDEKSSYVTINDQKVLSIKKLSNNKHIEKAKEISKKLNDFLYEKKLRPNDILPAIRDNKFIIKSGNDVLFEIEKDISLNEKKSSYQITLEWTNNIRKAFGSKPLDQKISRSFNRNYVSQIGYASWYGGKFHGRKTSSGELFNMNSFTAAHRSLPLGTNVLVTNLDNGKSIIVKINDRGPFSEPGKRIIDLSKEAFKSLSYLGKGIIRVKIETL